MSVSEAAVAERSAPAGRRPRVRGAVGRGVRAALGVRSPDASVPKWHVSPVVDVGAYALSWLWVLVPMLFVGDRFRIDYLGVYLVVLVATDVHRHFGMPYVYFDRQVFTRHPIRFTAFPLLMAALFAGAIFAYGSRATVSPLSLALCAGALAGFISVLRSDRPDGPGLRAATVRALTWTLGVGSVAVAGVWLLTGGAPGTGPRVSAVFNAIAVFAAVWNIWHVYMQKYGIFRMYNAKHEGEAARARAAALAAGEPTERDRSSATATVPGWVDRLLIFAWLPLYFAWLSPRYAGVVFENFSQGRATLEPVLAFFTRAEPFLLPPSFALVAVSIGLFVYYEHRASGLRNAPRLWMAVGTTLLASSFLWIHPVKAYLAYAFSHAVEYMVFVWAYQRRRYQAPLSHQPLLGRILRHPAVAYLGFVLVLGAAFLYLKYYGRWIFPTGHAPTIFGWSAVHVVAVYTIYQSMWHFYFDGFLWKMRLPINRATI
ncbi:MAG: hypothetical protein KC543_10450 [Myxococcales bacterium]|nr:hypothetical protein [Myxococcales bacterium]